MSHSQEFHLNRITIIISLAFALGGCAFTPQAVLIAPKINVPQSQVGNARELLLNVVDERPKKTLGTVGASGVGADLSVEGDLVTSVERALMEGLTKLSFKPSAMRGTLKSELRVEIKNLDYLITHRFWSGALRVDAGLKAICVRDGIRSYEKLYHGEFVESVQVVQSSAANAQYINNALSAAANDLLSDQELITCLAQKA